MTVLEARSILSKYKTNDKYKRFDKTELKKKKFIYMRVKHDNMVINAIYKIAKIEFTEENGYENVTIIAQPYYNSLNTFKLQIRGSNKFLFSNISFFDNEKEITEIIEALDVIQKDEIEILSRKLENAKKKAEINEIQFQKIQEDYPEFFI